MDIKRVQNADRMVLTNDQGQTMSVSIMEFWEICRFGARLETRDEVKNFLKDCEEIGGLNADKILENEDLMNQIVEGVIAKRSGSENGDQIYEVAEKKVKEQLEQKVTLSVREYADEDEEKLLKRIEFMVGYSTLAGCVNELGYLSVEEFVKNHNNNEAKTVYDYMKAFGNVLFEKEIDCEVVKYTVYGVNSMGSTWYLGNKNYDSCDVWPGAPKEKRAVFDSKEEALKKVQELNENFKFGSTRHYIEPIKEQEKKASLDTKLTSAKETVKREVKEQSNVQHEINR